MRFEQVLRIAIVGLTLALVIIVANSFRENIVEAGDKAPDFRIVTDNGKTVTRSDFGGRVLVLNFWATWCPPCIEELPSLNAMQQALGPSGVVVLAISVDRNENVYKEFLRRVPVTFQTARDPDGKISSLYGTFKFPETYVIDSTGTVRQKHIANKDWMEDSMINSIKALL